MLTAKKAYILSGILTSDLDRAKRLLTMQSADEVLSQINSLGYDFTLGDIKDYGIALKVAAAQGELLDVSALDTIAGGFIFTAPVAAFVTAAIGYLIDNDIGICIKW